VRELAEWLQGTSFSVTIQSVSWVVPLLQSIHIVTIGVVFVSSFMIALRVLGRIRTDEPFAAVWGQFSPWLWGGLGVMAVTGGLLVVGEPVREATSLSFWMKMILLVVAVAGTALFGRSLAAAARVEFPSGAKGAAVALLVLWIAIIFLGRAIAYDVEVWGPLSPSA